MCSLKRFFVFVIVKLAALSNRQSCILALTGRCNECFSNGIACLDERNFAVCIDNTTTAVSTPCPIGYVCTTEEDICLATAQGALPVCYEDQCGQCSSIRRNFACLDETTYAFCYDGQTPASTSINICPEGLVCDLNNTGICSNSQATQPSCIPRTNAATTDSTTDASTDTPTTSETNSATSLISDSTVDSVTDSTTDVTTNPTTTDSSTDEVADTTTTVLMTTISTVTGITTSTYATSDSTTVTTTDTQIGTTNGATTDTNSDTTTNTMAGMMTSSTDITIEPTDFTTATDTSFVWTTDRTTNSITGSPTVAASDSTTSTTSPGNTTPVDSNQFCAGIGRKGNFRLDGDTTCANYIHCYLLAGQYLGWRYTCSNYFNAATGLCQTDRPTNC